MRSENDQEPNRPAPSAAGSSAPASDAPPARPRRREKPSRSHPAPPDVPVHVDLSIPPDRRIGQLTLSFEALLYGLIFVAAILTRFWDLGMKALHHDESLHAYYSYQFATTGDYIHDPMMHGPFLFIANALAYLLFGDSDASSRYVPAFFGVMIVMLPVLLRAREHLGRWGALIASFLFLISPTILYQSRYIRHDIYTVAGALLLFVCIVRYISRPERRWLIIGSVSISFLLTNHEIVFAILVIFFGYLYASFMVARVQAIRRTDRGNASALIGLHAGALFILFGLLTLLPASAMETLLDIPWENPTTDEQWDYYGHQLSNPLVIGLVLLIVGFIAGHFLIMKRVADPEIDREYGLVEATLTDAEPQSISAAVRNAWRDRPGLTIAILAGVFLFVALYTTLFTNRYGLVSSTIATDGTLLYWLGQHDYRRGEQPWFYFLVMMPQYEFFGLLFGGGMVLLTIIRFVRGFFNGGDHGRFAFFRLFLSVWAVLIFAGLSYAGEKMPWLIVHIAEPFVLLAAIAIAGMAERAVEGYRSWQTKASTTRLPAPEVALGATLLLAAGAWFFIAARLSFGEFIDAPQPGGITRTVTGDAADRWYWLMVPILIAGAAIAASAFLRGIRTTALTTLGALTVLLIALQIHSGWRLSYINPDIPDEMMIYTQTSPDVTRVMAEVEQLSAELYGDKSITIWFDSEVSWPFWWYLREYSNVTYYGNALSGPPGDADVVIASEEGGSGARFLAGYDKTEYVLRWWFPEELYRDFALAPELPPGRSAWLGYEQPHGPLDVLRSILESLRALFEPDSQIHLYRLVVYRDLEQPIGQYRFMFYVRQDHVPALNDIRY